MRSGIFTTQQAITVSELKQTDRDDLIERMCTFGYTLRDGGGAGLMQMFNEIASLAEIEQPLHLR